MTVPLNSFTRQSWTFLRTPKLLLTKVWNKCNKLKAIQKIHQFYTISGLIRMKLEEAGPSKIIPLMVGLKDLFPDMDIKNL